MCRVLRAAGARRTLVESITSTANPLIRRLRKLRGRKFRESEGVFLIEGIAHVRQAMDHGARFESILVSPELLSSHGALAEVEKRRAEGVNVIELGREAFESVTERDHPSGLAATVHMDERRLNDHVARRDRFSVALMEVGNPGNLGTIIRTVDAVGGDAVIVVGDSTDEYHPAAVKASMGTIFSVPVYRAATLYDLFAWTLMEDVPVVATSARATQSFWDSEFPVPCVFLFGSEAAGLPAEAIERCAGCVSMPMEGAASSLNLAVSAGVLLYEAKRRLTG